jgi:putative ABC transport system permease protein
MLRRPGPTLLSLAVLTVGIAAATFMYAVVDAAQFAALPFQDGERLMLVSHRPVAEPEEWEALTAADTAALRARSDVFERFGAFQQASITLSDATGAERFAGARVTPGFFTQLGISPVLGRDLGVDDRADGGPRALLLSDELWRTRFNADPGVLGRAVKVNQQDGVVVGVMPPGFAFPADQKLWMSVDDPAGEIAQREGQRYLAFAHLRPGQTPEGAARALSDTWEALAQQDPQYHAGMTLGIKPVSYYFVDPQSRAFQWAMFVSVLGLLAIAIANAAAISAAEVLGRQHELALRAALGASRLRLLRTELLHALGLGLVAGLLAIGLAELSLAALSRALTASEDPQPYWLTFSVSGRVWAFATVIAVLAALASRVGPAWSVTALADGLALREGERGGVSQRQGWTTSGLLALQLALSVCLAVGTLVLARGVAHMWTRDLGADPTGVLTARVALHGPAYETAEARARFHAELGLALRAVPGVEAASVGSAVPGSTHDEDPVETRRSSPGEALLTAAWGAVDAGYLQAYGLRLQAGRWFDARETPASAPVAVVDAAFAARHWPGEDPIGQQVRLEPDDATSPWRSVIGVVDPVLLAEVDDREHPAMFVPLVQQPRRFVSVALRTRGDPYALTQALREAVRRLDPDAPVYWVRSHAEAVAHGRSMAVVIATLFSAFGGIALLLAAAGTYGVVASSVGRRVRELGIRRALGAEPLALVRAASASTLRWATAGVVVGMLLAVPAGRTLAGLAPGILPFDAWTLVGVAVTMVVTVAAGLIAPIRRAVQVDPMVVLREE